MKMSELLDTYYAGFAQKKGWDTVLSDDFAFIGGDMTKPNPSIGKDAYKAVIDRFSRLFTHMRVQHMIIQDQEACVIANYDYVFPNGEQMNGNVAEIWTLKDDKLASLTIFFDTQTFRANTP